MIIHPGHGLPFAALTGLIWSASELSVFLRDLQRGTGKRADRGSRLFLIACIAGAIWLALQASFARVAPLPGTITAWHWLGGLVLAGGIILRQYAVWWLGAQFRTRVTLLEGHRLIENGPYRHVRHPSYTGATISALGYGILLADAASVAVLVILPLIGFAYRIRVEEQALSAHFGDAWQIYRNRTATLIPRIW